MSDFYTNVICLGNNILYRGIEKGKRVKKVIPYSPTLFVSCNNKSEYRTLHGNYLAPLKFLNIKDARDYIKQFDSVENFKIYGNTRYEYAFISERFSDSIDWSTDNLSIGVIDIEVGSENGFPDPYKAIEPITAITISYINGKTFVFGCNEYSIVGDEQYIRCSDEYDLCSKFLRLWTEKTPDIITGWNIKFFDIPYLVNRFSKLMGKDSTLKLSPWEKINERTVSAMGRENIAYELLGVATLDYIEMYRWFAPDGKSQESYRLDNIAHVELQERKLSYDEYGSLHQLYKLNYQKFIEYNIKDVHLILRLDDKLGLINQALTLAYDTKTNYEDVFAQTRMWDALIYDNLIKDKIVVPPKTSNTKDERYEGAYVKEVQVGMHKHVASFDLDSLYPHLMMQYNISPETLIEPDNYTPEMRRIISEGVSVDKLLNKEIDLSGLKDVTLTPNGQFFRTDIQGFLPKMLSDMYNARKVFKGRALAAKQEYVNEKDPDKKFEISKVIAKCNNLQLAKKLSLNSVYGAMGSQYFRFYDLRIAMAVTTAGQLSIRWIEHKLNEYMNNLLKSDNVDYVIASDTDSIYLRLDELVEKVYGVNGVVDIPKHKIIDFMDKVCETKLKPYIDVSYQELATYVNAYAQKMSMKREALADKGIWTAKKRYILNVYNNEGVQYDEPYMKVMGLEMIKSSTPSAIRDKMSEVIKLMLLGTEKDVQQFIENFRKDFKKLPAEDISFPRGCNNLDKYSDKITLYKPKTPIQVKGAILYNHFLKEYGLTKQYPLIQEGEKVKFTYLKQPNIFKDTVISFPINIPKEFKLDSYIDYDTQFDKAFLEPVKVILDCIGWNHEEVNTLNRFFK